MSNRVHIRRDPFARLTITRELVETKATCAWCGQHHHAGKLFRYWIEHDSGRQDAINGLFCSFSCSQSYAEC